MQLWKNMCYHFRMHT